LGNAMKRFL